tara:strand:+ start:154 stop:498 length:345 start_codon:yes stop_codon:yes gene_type:complete
MSNDFKQWVYHKTKAPKVISSNEFETQKALGWSDTPADFILISDFGIDGSDASQVQVLGEAIQGVRDAANGALNISEMSKKELEDYAMTHFNVELDRRRSAKKLRQEVITLIGK